MKKIAAAFLAVLTTTALHGQGTFAFNNFLNAPAPAAVTNELGQYIGADFTVSLYWATGNATDPNALLLFSSANTPFFGVTGGTPSTDGAGYFDGGVVSLPAVGTNLVTLQIRAWRSSGAGAGTSWESSQERSPLTGTGAPNLIQLMLASAGNPPQMDGLLSSGVINIPEPSTLALAGLAAGAVLWFRRRRS